MPVRVRHSPVQTGVCPRSRRPCQKAGKSSLRNRRYYPVKWAITSPLITKLIYLQLTQTLYTLHLRKALGVISRTCLKASHRPKTLSKAAENMLLHINSTIEEMPVCVSLFSTVILLFSLSLTLKKKKTRLGMLSS